MTAPAASTFETRRAWFQKELMARLPGQIARLGWDAASIEEHQQERLRLLLARAIERSPFHARRLAGIDPDRFALGDLPLLPVMTKAGLMDNFDDVLTDRRLSRGLVEAHLASIAGRPEFLLGDYLCLTSGGSSGVRGVFVFDLEGILNQVLAILRPSIARMMAAGGPPPGGLVVGVVAAPTAIHATRAGTTLVNGGPAQVVQAPATLPLPEIVARLNAGQPHLLIGYPSVIRQLAVEREAGRLTISPMGISVTSEQLTGEVRDAITAGFGVPVVNMFGSTEGLIGSSNPGEDAITFASDLAIIELVDEQWRPVAPGPPSAKVLVTNLCSDAQPLIRYEMDDSFVALPGRGHGHLIATVSGRNDEVFVYRGVSVHPLVIRSVLVKTPAVTEYRVTQTENGLDVEVVAAGALDEGALAGRLGTALEGAGLPGAAVTVRRVDLIARDAGTGKVRRFVRR